VRVVELGVWVAGPAAGGILADWGAEVVKLEPPGGDPARSFAEMLGADLPFNPPFELDNRGKRSVAVDLSSPAGAQVAGQLLERADVFVTNLRPLALARLGLDPASQLAAHPRLVYGLISGYGTEGPDRDRPAYDIGAFWARSGLAHLLTPPGADPVFQRGGMGDHSAAMTLVAAVCAALYARASTGQGQLVSTSLLRQGLYTIGFDVSVALRFGREVGTPTRATMANPLINCYRDAEGRWFWLVGLEADRHWPGLARAVGHEEWLADPRFATRRARARNCAELVRLLDEEFSRQALAAWGESFDRHGVWWAPVQSPSEALSDPQVRASGALVEVAEESGTTTLLATPADFTATPASVRSMAPGLGQHTDEVLAELGHDSASIRRLRETGAVG